MEVPAAGANRAASSVTGPRQIIMQADRLPFEYRADLQLTTLEKKPNLPKKWTIEVLESLNKDAFAAQFQYRLRDITGDNFSRSRRLDFAFDTRVDAMSVHVRVVDLLRQLDDNLALQTLREIPLNFSPVPCSAPNVYDVADYYTELQTVLVNDSHLRTPSPITPIDIFQEEIHKIGSPVQLAPFLGVLAAYPMSGDDLKRLGWQFAAALDRLQATDRELTFIEGTYRFATHSLSESVGSLASKLGSGTSETAAVLAAYRGFLIRSARAEECFDFGADRDRITKAFNRLAQQYQRDGSVPLLHTVDLKPGRIGSGAHIERIPNAGDFGRQFTPPIIAYRTAQMHDPNGATTLPASSWEPAAAELLERTDRIDTSVGDCHACLFQEKAEVLFSLFDLVPESSMKLRILDHLVEFMADDAAQQENPMEWLYRFKMLLNLARQPSESTSKRIQELQKGDGPLLLFLPSQNGKEILAAIARQDSDLMQQYASAEKILKLSYILPPYL